MTPSRRTRFLLVAVLLTVTVVFFSPAARADNGGYDQTDQDQASASINGGGFIESLFTNKTFESVNLLDIVVFGGLVFLLFNYLSSRGGRLPEKDEQEGPLEGQDGGEQQSDVHRVAQMMWQRIREQDEMRKHEGKGAPPGSPGSSDGDIIDSPGLASEHGPDYVLDAGPSTPPDFEAKEFLRGAQMVFARVVESFGKGDLNDLRAFTTQQAFNEFEAQLRGSGEPRPARVNSVRGELRQVVDKGGMRRATVLLQGMVENAAGLQAAPLRALWTFVKPLSDPEALWLLHEMETA